MCECTHTHSQLAGNRSSTTYRAVDVDGRIVTNNTHCTHTHTDDADYRKQKKNNKRNLSYHLFIALLREKLLVNKPVGKRKIREERQKKKKLPSLARVTRAHKPSGDPSSNFSYEITKVRVRKRIPSTRSSYRIAVLAPRPLCFTYTYKKKKFMKIIIIISQRHVELIQRNYLSGGSDAPVHAAGSQCVIRE